MEYYISYNVGKVKYCVSYHSDKFHKDGSKFYDVQLFSNKKQMNSFVNELKSKGFIEK